jgi:hypothetical protein
MRGTSRSIRRMAVVYRRMAGAGALSPGESRGELERKGHAEPEGNNRSGGEQENQT